MRIALSLGVALTTCACAGHAIEPRSAVRDTFPERFHAAQVAAPAAQGVQSRSLGFIGDAPIGLEPNPPYHLPWWERPFPCEWTNTCQILAPRVYYAPCRVMWGGPPLPAP
jgi:hypothetical protein